MYSDKQAKDEELFDPEQGYLIITSTTGSPVEPVVVAYLGLRVIMEDTAESLRQGTREGMIPVLYIYEMQVDARYRGLGLGQWLINQGASGAAEAVGVDKVMLTCLKSESTPSYVG